MPLNSPFPPGASSQTGAFLVSDRGLPNHHGCPEVVGFDSEITPSRAPYHRRHALFIGPPSSKVEFRLTRTCNNYLPGRSSSRAFCESSGKGVLFWRLIPTTPEDYAIFRPNRADHSTVRDQSLLTSKQLVE